MAQTSTEDTLPEPVDFAGVKGWFWPVDQLLFDWFLSRERGDLLELGAYLGKSAIFMGGYLRDGDAFTVCDLWDSPAPDDPNSAEMNRSYATLTRRAFEANYLSFHDALPRMVQAPTSVITSEVRAGSCRFVHVDASHLYEHVRGDIASAKELLRPDGIVAFDDFRAEHCPGVAAAVWGAVATSGLKPIVITGTKLYGTWGEPRDIRDALGAWLGDRSDLWWGTEEVAGRPLIRVKPGRVVPPPAPSSRHEPPAPEPAPDAVDAVGSVAPVAPVDPAPARVSARPPSRARSLTRDLLPPILTRALASRRTG
ncbi:class I SAM-dependent methyltransferase [Streptomyces sp. NPDC055078]